MKILIVDDDPVSRLALEGLIESLGYKNIHICTDGEEAWQYFSHNIGPILCCCDNRMPKISGVELLQKIRSDPYLSDMPFVFITSGADRSVVGASIKLKIDGYIVKPFNAAEAGGKLMAILKKRMSEYAETPQQTSARLNISNDKLSQYYAAFKAQIITLESKLRGLTPTEIVTKLSAIETGCLTLGLLAAANYTQALMKYGDSGNRCSYYLRHITRMLEQQEAAISKKQRSG
jgi:two-component system, chemotaxis family, chemotaxis protein CheY